MPEGPPPAPAVQKLRLRYAKRGRLRFTSHRDFQRAFERALRRSEVPMAYSAGFTPHPKVSYAGAAPTGVASEAEYLELSVARRCEPAELCALLDASLPPGLDVLEVVEAAPGNLAERLQASVWEIRLPEVEPETAAKAVAAFMGAESVQVERMTKNGMRTFDARAAVAALDSPLERGTPSDDEIDAGHPGVDGSGDRPCAILRLVVRHTTPAVRPDDVLSGLRLVADLAPPVPAAVTRLAQGPLDAETGAVTDPLAPEHAVTSTGNEEL
ncbi:TIGR03936 family radical SAM-associated protein [Yinghuangia seranimata]|uniref:TIGR03936 family radical SAM-associated protein n=1 Tax=Yinghuangia seranimata TaxID=408067 RepID=UPI00248AA5E1|nr:TIGR03936 family radical SAM-associated protein [Yinghuangia seranimata]MDI2127396.1 TIGR03936 family radical SAM-associated protein [Yinghuangia seranimata]